jgi:hypothetical protein
MIPTFFVIVAVAIVWVGSIIYLALDNRDLRLVNNKLRAENEKLVENHEALLNEFRIRAEVHKRSL